MKSVGVPSTPLARPLTTSRSIRSWIRWVVKIAIQAHDIQAHLGGIPGQVAFVEDGPIAEQQVVHLPELTLHGRCFGQFGRGLSVRVNFAKGKVAEDEIESRAGAEQIRDDIQRQARIRTLVVAVHDQLAGPFIATNVVEYHRSAQRAHASWPNAPCAPGRAIGRDRRLEGGPIPLAQVRGRLIGRLEELQERRVGIGASRTAS